MLISTENDQMLQFNFLNKKQFSEFLEAEQTAKTKSIL
jgi:hypothetical protein